MIKVIDRGLKQLFFQHFGVEVHAMSPMPRGGSDRQYFRLRAEGVSAVGAYNPNVDENETFFYLTGHFLAKGFPVPSLLEISTDRKLYLLSDLGDDVLFNRFVSKGWEGTEGEENLLLAKESLKLLAHLQVEGAKELDFSKCYPKTDFDQQAVMWDFSYFKYSFLKPSGIGFNEQLLEDDFLAFAKILLSHTTGFFHFRDFQSRNVMLVNNKPHFIDYQGGRRGPLLYDAASFLYQARAQIPDVFKNELFSIYLDELEEITPIDREQMLSHLSVFALFRVIQTLGAYGYRGFFERRGHFLQSIPFAAANLPTLLEEITSSGLVIPHLKEILLRLAEQYGESATSQHGDGLTVEVCSFSFLRGYPTEHPQHGGGFVFDCRALPNPGRLDAYKMQTGMDAPVISYLEDQEEIHRFYSDAWDLVSPAIATYLHRGFKHLSVSFGCTGGQHRSVYMAEWLARTIQEHFPQVTVRLAHREMGKKY